MVNQGLIERWIVEWHTIYPASPPRLEIYRWAHHEGGWRWVHQSIVEANGLVVLTFQTHDDAIEWGVRYKLDSLDWLSVHLEAVRLTV